MKLGWLVNIPDDYPELYGKWTRGLRKGDRARILAWTDKVLVALFAALYAFFALACCLASAPAAGFAFFVSTALCFFALSAVRRFLDEPRPYQRFLDLKPLVPRSGSGRSFPSRHGFCAFLIGTMLWAIDPGTGIAAIVAAAALCAARVLEGSHYPRDVIAAAVLGIPCGFLCITVVALA